MEYVDLDRHFAFLLKDKEAIVDWSPIWGRRYGGWLNWDQLLTYRRVALLAEALSGKTRELENRAKALKQQGKAAFFVRIEDLADRGFKVALDEEDISLFQEWKETSRHDAWFFLDSVDEARLNRKSFVNALRTFRAELGTANLNRSFIIVSCRASDWKGKADVEVVQNGLPFKEEAVEEPVLNVDEALLAPIFKSDKTLNEVDRTEQPLKPSELVVVQLLPLTTEQKKLMAEVSGADGAAFLDAILQSGLETMSERPGDLLDLLDYWNEYKKFSSLKDMMANSVARKLRELNLERGSSGLLSQEMARLGAERVAGALMFAKTFVIKAPTQEPDPTLSRGAIDAAKVLDDWNAEQVGALLRTGLFAPSTYGRIKFHHRSTQEYLAARWLQSLMDANLPYTEVRDLLFADKYGVKTAVPSLLPITAWLAQWSDGVRQELIAREPATLITGGDAKSLPRPAKEALLASYSTLDATGDLDADLIDDRAAWMFSEPELGHAIRRAWKINDRPNFRLQLLTFIAKGKIASCTDLAREVATFAGSEKYARIIATEALVACNDEAGLKAVAKKVRSEPELFGALVAPNVALTLYPKFLSTEDLVRLIDRTPPSERYSSDGFASHLAVLYQKAPDRVTRAAFVKGIAGILEGNGLVEEDEGEPSGMHSHLCQGLPELLVAELETASGSPVSLELIKLMMVVERASHEVESKEHFKALLATVRKNPELNRCLMWADEAHRRRYAGGAAPAIRHWQIGPHTGRQLWSISLDDAAWLALDTVHMPEESQRRIAFGALVQAYLASEQLSVHRPQIDELAGREPVLKADLDAYLTPPQPSEWETEHRAYVEKLRVRREADQQSWRDFRTLLVGSPDILDRPENLKDWRSGIHRLWDLTRWVKNHTQHQGQQGMHGWQALARVFSPETEKHYRQAMSKAWRTIRPERPKFTGPNTFTTKHVSGLAIDAIELESLAHQAWPRGLTDEDVQLAATHLVMTGNVREPYFERLVTDRLRIVLPVVIDGVRAEFRSGGNFHDILSHAAHSETGILECVALEVFRLLKAAEPVDKSSLGYCIRIIQRAVTNLPQKALLSLSRRRVGEHLTSGDVERAFEYLGLLASLDGEALGRFLLTELCQRDDELEEVYRRRVQKWLGAAFDSRVSGGFAMQATQTMSVAVLSDLVRLAYRHVHPKDDRRPSASTTVSARDRAEGARHSLLEALLRRSGSEAYSAVLALSQEPDFAVSALRFKEIAHSKAQADTDLIPWTELEVLNFAKSSAAPAKSGHQMMRLTKGVLETIALELTTADASSRALLALAEREEPVQEWLAERLREKGRGRYITHRENQVASKNEPDITLSSSSAAVEIAIEVKNANMGWTLKQLESALRKQLAQDYLLPESRRHGFLVVSLHRHRTWHVDGAVWSFERVIKHLKSLAETIKSNRVGEVEVNVIALNALSS